MVRRLLDFAKKMRGGQLVALSFVVAALLACSGEVSVDQNFVDTFVELRVVDVAYGTNSPVTRIARQEILKKHGYTLEKYLAKSEKVLDDESMWVPFQKAVVARVDTLIAGLNASNLVEKPVAPPTPKSVPNAPSKRKRGDD